MAIEKDKNAVIVDQVYNKEMLIAQANQDGDDNDFKSYLGLLDGERDEKTYEWQSDIRIPEFMSHYLTQASIDVSQYFGTRDFVEVKINDPSDQAKASAEASKELLNRTLNRRDLHHYQKFVRGKGVCTLVGKVYLKCWWEQEFENKQVGTELAPIELDTDVNGQPMQFDFQEPEVVMEEQPVFGDVAVVDKFNYDVWDQRNVFTSDDFAYSLQDKEWVEFRSETTLSELKESAELNEYFDLDKIGKPPSVTDTKEQSYQEDDTKTPYNSAAQKPFDLIERYGKMWFSKDGKKGIDDNGDVSEGATYEEAITTIVKSNSIKTLIGFKKTGFIDANGRPYRPIARGLCYVHPTKDTGMGDGQNTRELQTAMDDTFNASQDRVILATFPSLKGAKQSIEDNSSIYIEPMHMMELEDVNDVQEFKITDNIAGALSQLAYLEDKGRQVDSINETTTGGVPSIASTTATAVGAATQNTNTRMNYKSLTYEYTALTELYWIIQQMTSQFAQEETGFKLMGDKVYDFDPSLDYYYSPVSQSIESEQSKALKRREWTSLLQTVVQIQHPDAVKLINFIIIEIVKLMGDEYENVMDKALDENVPVNREGQQQQGSESGVPASNQFGIAQTPEETVTREASFA